VSVQATPSVRGVGVGVTFFGNLCLGYNYNSIRAPLTLFFSLFFLLLLLLFLSFFFFNKKKKKKKKPYGICIELNGSIYFGNSEKHKEK
jgi:hypothetical protein